MQKKGLGLLLAGLAFLVLSVKPAAAAEMQFSVQAEIPKNQVDKTKSYFDLKMQPGQEQDLVVNMRNDTAKPITVNVLPNTATTNDNGIVAYNEQKKNDQSLKIPFKDIATTDKEVTVPAKSSQSIKVKVKMPKASFDGTVLGGIYFSEKVADTKTKSSETSQIVNRYAYVIGVKLTETDKKVKPDLHLKSVKPSQVNYRNVVNANIQNDQAAILTDLTISGKIYEKGDSKVLYQAKRDKLRMAPNSNFNFGISLNSKTFKPGRYTFKGTAKSGQQHWRFQKDFEIKSAEANKYNKKDVSIEQNHTNLYLIAGAGIVLILIIIIVILMRKLRDNKKEV